MPRGRIRLHGWNASAEQRRTAVPRKKSAYLNRPSTARFSATPSIGIHRARATREPAGDQPVGNGEPGEQRDEADIPPAIEEQRSEPRRSPVARHDATAQRVVEHQHDRQEAADEGLGVEQHGAVISAPDPQPSPLRGRGSSAPPILPLPRSGGEAGRGRMSGSPNLFQRLQQPRHQRRARCEVLPQYVLVAGVRAGAGTAETIQRRHAHRRGEVAVRTAAAVLPRQRNPHRLGNPARPVVQREDAGRPRRRADGSCRPPPPRGSPASAPCSPAASAPCARRRRPNSPADRSRIRHRARSRSAATRPTPAPHSA